MFSILGWIVFGLIVGALAKLVMPGRDPGGIIVTIVLGIVGAVLGGWLCHGADRSADPARTVPAARRPTRLGVLRTGLTGSRGRSVRRRGIPSRPLPRGGATTASSSATQRPPGYQANVLDGSRRTRGCC